MIGSPVAFADNEHLRNALKYLSYVTPINFPVQAQLNVNPIKLTIGQLSQVINKEDPCDGHCEKAKNILSHAVAIANIINTQTQRYNSLNTSNAATEKQKFEEQKTDKQKIETIIKSQVQQYNSLIKEASSEVKMAISYWNEHQAKEKTKK